jgi:hypothetical protein
MIAMVGEVVLEKRSLMRRYVSTHDGIEGICGLVTQPDGCGFDGEGIGLQNSKEIEGVAEWGRGYKVGLRLWVCLISRRG